VLETEPTEGTADHLTEVLELPVTDAVNCFVWVALSETEFGLNTTPTGARDTVALADLVESAELVAVTMTFC